MRNDSAMRALAVVALILSALILAGALTFAGPCVHDDGSFSTCHDAQIGIIVGAVAAGACSAGALVLNRRRAAGALMLAAAAIGAFIALAPGVIFPLCFMQTMRCHAIMQPFAQFTGVALAAIGIIAGIRALRMRREGARPR